MSNDIYKKCTHIDHEGERLLHASSFYTSKHAKDGLYSNCKKCTRKQQAAYRDAHQKEIKLNEKEYYINNKEKIKTKVSLWQKENKNKVNETSKRYRSNNKEKRKEVTKRWRDKNKELSCHLANKRRTNKIKATPEWFEDIEVLKLYESSTKGKQVHHIVPLQENDQVCGLHCKDNLVVLTEAQHKTIHSDSLLLEQSMYWDVTKFQSYLQ